MRVLSRLRTHRRYAAVLAVTLAAASAPVVSASPVDAAECPEGLSSCIVVSVIETEGGTKTVLYSETVSTQEIRSWSDFRADRQYRKRKNLDGALSDGPLVKAGLGLTLNGLLKRVSDLHPDVPTEATFSETPNASGVPAVLSDAELADPKAPSDDDYPFIEGRTPALYVNGSGIGYVRPLRDAKTDVNASDIFTVKGRLDLVIHTTGELLEPTVTSSAGTALKTKDKTTFSATFAQGGTPEIVSTRWDFGDGTTPGTKRDEPTHAYTKRGTFPVVVTVRGADGSYGRSAPVEIKVDKPPKAPSSGAGGTGGGTGGLGGLGGYVPPLDPGLGNLPPVTPPADDLPEDMTPQAPVDDGLEQVEGFVLAGSELAPGGVAEQIPGTSATDEAAPVGQESTRRRLATWIVVALAAALLLGAGAASETRWFRTQLRHLRRRA